MMLLVGRVTNGFKNFILHPIAKARGDPLALANIRAARATALPISVRTTARSNQIGQSSTKLLENEIRLRKYWQRNGRERMRADINVPTFSIAPTLPRSLRRRQQVRHRPGKEQLVSLAPPFVNKKMR
jgi:hypothetical protein